MRFGHALAALAFATAAVPALAEEATGNDPGSGDVVQMTLDQLKEKCLQLQNDVDHGQMKPFNVNIECARDRTYWEPQKGTLVVPQSTFFTGGADVKGRFVVPPERRETDRRDVTKECEILYEWHVQSYKVPVTLATCRELLPVHSLAFFCAEQLKCRPVDEAEPVKTGRKVDTCAATITDPCQPGQGQTAPAECQNAHQ